MKPDKYRMKLLGVSNASTDENDAMKEVRRIGRESRQAGDDVAVRTRKTIRFLQAMWICLNSEKYYDKFNRLSIFESKLRSGR